MPYHYKNEYQDYRNKQAYLTEHLTPVSPREFYDDIFPDELLERPGHPEDEKPNMIIAVKTKDNNGHPGFQNEVIFQGKEGLERAYKAEFALCGLCLYSGRRRTAKNAFLCLGFAIDLDGVRLEECKNLFYGIEKKILPCPQYIVNSGHGLHLYYLFENPVPLYPAVRVWLPLMKRGLTKIVWSNDTSYIQSNPSKDERDYLPIYQQMRMPGSCSKIGRGKAKTKYLVSAYRWNTYKGVRVSFSYLNSFLDLHGLGAYKVPDNPDYASWDYEHLSLSEAKKLYPDWYQKRIVEGKPAGQYVQNRGLYEWWLNRIQIIDPDNPLQDWNCGARDGTRYHCICILFVMAIKAGIEFDEVMADALGLVPLFDSMTQKSDNPFTEQDVIDASKFYKRSYARMSSNAIVVKTKLKWERPKRNGRKQEQHLQLARGIRQIKGEMGEQVSGGGRPDKADQVKAWRSEHPEGRKVDCIRETGLSKPTVLKWWNV